MRARGPLLALLAVALLAWLAVATRPAPPAEAVTAARGGGAAAPVVRDFSDFDRIAARLGEGQPAAAPRPVEPTRNPFRFVAPRPKPAASPKSNEAAAALAALAPLVLPPTPVTLVGVVDRQQNGRPVRIAVLSFGGELHYVEAGSRLGGAYEVVAVGANAVDLLALDTNTTRRLVQR